MERHFYEEIYIFMILVKIKKMKIVASLISILNSFKRVSFAYTRTLYNDFDAIQAVPTLEPDAASQQNYSFLNQRSIGHIRYNVRYLLPFLINFLTLADTFAIYCKADFQHENLGDSDDLINRKLFPTNVWREADVVFNVILLWSTGILACVLLQNLAQWNDGKMYSVVRSDGTLERMVQLGKGYLGIHFIV